MAGLVDGVWAPSDGAPVFSSRGLTMNERKVTLPARVSGRRRRHDEGTVANKARTSSMALAAGRWCHRATDASDEMLQPRSPDDMIEDDQRCGILLPSTMDDRTPVLCMQA